MHGSGKVGGGNGLFIPNLDHVEGEPQARQEESPTGPTLADVGQLAAPVPGTKVDPTPVEAAFRRDSNSRCSTVKTATEAASWMVTPWEALPPSVKAFLSTVGRPDVNSTRLAKLAKAMDQCTAPTHWPDKDFLASIG